MSITREKVYGMQTVAYYNGEIGTIEELKLPVNDRAVYFGDGVYDVAVAEHYHTFELDRHIDRFYCSMKQLEFSILMTKDELKALILNLLKKIDLPGNAMIYWQASRATAMRNHQFPKDKEANLLITIKPFDVVKELRYVQVITTPETRYNYCNVKTLNLLPNVLAAQKASEKGCYEAVFHKNGIVTECSYSNIHILKNGILQTAPLTTEILPGITRMQLLQVAHKNSIPINETAFTVEELMNADEIVVTNSGSLIRAVDEVDGKKVGRKDCKTLNLLYNEYMNMYFKSIQ